MSFRYWGSSLSNWLMEVINRITDYPKPFISEGTLYAEEALKALTKNDVKRVLILYDVEQDFTLLKKLLAQADIIHYFKYYPHHANIDTNLMALKQEYQNLGIDGVIAVGADTLIDASKLVMALLSNRRFCLRRHVLENLKHNITLVAIPTYPCGAETSMTVTYLKKTKKGFVVNKIMDRHLVVDYIIYSSDIVLRLESKKVYETAYALLVLLSEIYLCYGIIRVQRHLIREYIIDISKALYQQIHDKNIKLLIENMYDVSRYFGELYRYEYFGYLNICSEWLSAQTTLSKTQIVSYLSLDVFSAYGKKSYKTMAQIGDCLKMREKSKETATIDKVELLIKFYKLLQKPMSFETFKKVTLDEKECNAALKNIHHFIYPKTCIQHYISVKKLKEMVNNNFIIEKNDKKIVNQD